jgi:hypothetical protein
MMARLARERRLVLHVVKGAMIDETYAVFAAWDFERTKRENLDRLARRQLHRREERDLAPRRRQGAEPPLRSRRSRPPLVVLAQAGLRPREWKPLLLWHMTRDEFLSATSSRLALPAYDSGAFRVRPEELEKYLGDILQARRHDRARVVDRPPSASQRAS